MKPATPLQVQKRTKADFARYALSEGLCLLATAYNKEFNQLTDALDSLSEDQYSKLERDKVTGTAKHLVRHKPDGQTSHLELDADDAVYSYGPYWIVRTESAGTATMSAYSNSILYA